MSQALAHAGLPLEGRHHRGDDEAWNIGAIVIELARLATRSPANPDPQATAAPKIPMPAPQCTERADLPLSVHPILPTAGSLALLQRVVENTLCKDRRRIDRQAGEVDRCQQCLQLIRRIRDQRVSRSGWFSAWAWRRSV